MYFGRTGLNLLQNYVDEANFDVYEGPRKQLNLWVLIRTLFSGRLNSISYYHAYLRFTRPRYVLSREDNALEVYTTKRALPACTVICIQNGIRGRHSSSPNNSFLDRASRELAGSLEVDVLATFGQSSSLSYSLPKTIRIHRFAEIGSLKNNATPNVAIAATQNVPRLIFISTFPNLGRSESLSKQHDRIHGYWGDTPILMKHYFAAEALVASISADLASSFGLEFIVLGKRPSWQVAELDFYESVLSKQKWSFQAQTSEIANYQFVQPHDILVNIDSTFGYEMFGRGIRVAFASCRMAHSGNPNLPDGNFGFPLIDNPRGRYWTNSDDREEISRIIHWVASTELSEWHRVSQNEREKTMVFDPANKLFSDLLDSTGLLNRGPRFLEASRIITK